MGHDVEVGVDEGAVDGDAGVRLEGGEAHGHRPVLDVVRLVAEVQQPGRARLHPYVVRLTCIMRV